jgi:hypothetical protein
MATGPAATHARDSALSAAKFAANAAHTNLRLWLRVLCCDRYCGDGFNHCNHCDYCHHGHCWP